MIAMTTLTVRKVSDEVHRALRVQAASSGRSVEAELRLIIEQAVMPKINMADSLLQIGRELGGVEIEFARDRRPFLAPNFE
jgi:antitoxin FitA